MIPQKVPSALEPVGILNGRWYTKRAENTSELPSHTRKCAIFA